MNSITENLIEYEQNTSSEQKRLDQIEIEKSCPLTEDSVDAERFINYTLKHYEQRTTRQALE